MKTQNLLGLMLIGITLTSILLPAFSADQLLATDFQQESFQKTIDFFEYARAFATAHGIPENIPPYWHANLYMTYVNTSGLHMLYAGLINITFGLNAYFTIPMQTFMMHYKTENQTRDVLMASTFLMLLAFNETSDSIHQNSPDMNDTLWASFSMGFDLSQLGATLPILNSKTETIPLTSTTDKLQWTWGMKYTNLTAYWWQTWINPNDPHYQQNWPTAITVYDELTFTYNLTINPTTKTATLTENHIIGKMNHLLLFTAPFWLYLNNTGTYLLGNLVPNSPTIYQFLQENQIKMSIVNFQTSVLLDHTTYSQTTTGENVTDNEKIVSDSQISTYADDGEKIFDVAFGTKQTYKLYNYTADPTETQYDTYDSTTRTAKINSFANNTGLFTYHIGLMKFLPFVTYNMNPQLYNKAKDTITNMTKANYFYLTAYPTYSGYKIEHDPTFTIYLTPSAATAATPPNWIGIIILTAIIITTTATAIVIVRRRKHAQLTQTTQPPTKTA
jgi:hypothetical protein